MAVIWRYTSNFQQNLLVGPEDSEFRWLRNCSWAVLYVEFIWCLSLFQVVEETFQRRYPVKIGFRTKII